MSARARDARAARGRTIVAADKGVAQALGERAVDKLLGLLERDIHKAVEAHEDACGVEEHGARAKWAARLAPPHAVHTRTGIGEGAPPRTAVVETARQAHSDRPADDGADIVAGSSTRGRCGRGRGRRSSGGGWRLHRRSARRPGRRLGAER